MLFRFNPVAGMLKKLMQVLAEEMGGGGGGGVFIMGNQSFLGALLAGANQLNRQIRHLDCLDQRELNRSVVKVVFVLSIF
jgi:hypothetical protein